MSSATEQELRGPNFNVSAVERLPRATTAIHALEKVPATFMCEAPTAADLQDAARKLAAARHIPASR